MGQFLAPKGQLLPTTIADVKSRLRRAEHRIESIAQGGGSIGIEVTFSASLPDKAAVGDVWYETSGDSVVAQYQCVTAYASGAGVLGDWTPYTVDGSSLTAGTVASAQLSANAVQTANIAPNAVTTSELDSSVTSRALGGNITTMSDTEPGSPISGDTWIEIDGSGDITSIWSYDGTTWVEATIAISAGGVEITASTTEPGSPNINDIWIDESSGNALNQWDGTDWNPYQFGTGAVAPSSITTTELAPVAVTAGQIADGAVDGMVINYPTINGSTITASDFILSPGTNNAILAYGTPNGTSSFTNSTPGSYTATTPAGTSSMLIELWGGGGGGGGGFQGSGPTTSGGGGAGAGGGYTRKTVTISGGTGFSYVVGALGLGGTSSSSSGSTTNGAAGGNSTCTVSGTTYVAHGGGGGVKYPTKTGGTCAAGNGDVNYTGGSGGAAGGYGGGGGGGSAGPLENGHDGGLSTYAGGPGGPSIAYGGYGGVGAGFAADFATSHDIYAAGYGGGPGGGGGGGAAYNGPSGGGLADASFGGNGQVRITYSITGTPSLLATVSPVAGTDPYGQTVDDGFIAYYGTAKMQLHINDHYSSGAPALEAITGATSEAANGAVYGYVNNPGLSNEYMGMMLTGAESSVDDTAPHIVLFSSTADGSATGSIYYFWGDTTLAYMDYQGTHYSKPLWGAAGVLTVGDTIKANHPGSTTTIETPQTQTLVAPWTSVVPLTATYKADGTVTISGQIKPSSAVANTGASHICTLPSGYYNTTQAQTFVSGVLTSATGPVYTNAAVTLQVTTAGVLNLYGAVATTGQLSILQNFPVK